MKPYSGWNDRAEFQRFNPHLYCREIDADYERCATRVISADRAMREIKTWVGQAYHDLLLDADIAIVAKHADAILFKISLLEMADLSEGMT